MNVSRRFFLGGAISLIAAKTFVPSVSAMMNLPTIYGDGVRSDTAGLGALFRNEPCTFKKEQIGVDSHEGMTFHEGRFVIDQTINIPKNAKFKIEKVVFLGTKLENNQPFFMCEYGFDIGDNFKGGYGLIFEVNKSHVSRFFDFGKMI